MLYVLIAVWLQAYGSTDETLTKKHLDKMIGNYYVFP